MIKTPKEKTLPFAARLPVNAHKQIHSNAKAAGISARAWLTEVILANKTKIIARQKPHPDLSQLVFQVNKAGNNLNQIAKHINELALRGDLSYERARVELDKLLSIEATLKKAVERAS